MQDCIFYSLIFMMESNGLIFGIRKENQLKQKKKEEEEKAKAVRRVSASISPPDAPI
jgi:hypothetical protein